MKKTYSFFQSAIAVSLMVTAMLISCTKVKPKEEEKAVKLPAPAGLQAVVTENAVNITWTPVENAKCYSYVLDGAEEVYTNEPSLAFTGLEYDKEYNIKVKAVSSDLKKWEDSEWAATSFRVGKKPEEPVDAFAIAFEGVTSYSMIYTVVPADKKQTYFTDMMLKEDFDKFADGNALISAVIAEIKAEAEKNGFDFEAYCRSVSLLNEGDAKFQSKNDLKEQTEYVAVVFGLDYSGNATSELFSKVQKTEKEEEVKPSSMTFQFDVKNLTDVSAAMDITPSANDEYYYSFFVLKENLDNLGEDGLIGMCLESLNEYMISDDYQTVVSEQCMKGKQTITYSEMTPNTEYVGFAFGVGKQGNKIAASTKLFKTEPFMTKDTQQGEDPIRIEVISFTDQEVKIKFIPTQEAVPYRCELIELSAFSENVDETIISEDLTKLWNDYGEWYEMMLQTTEFTMTRVNPLKPDTDYIIFAYGVGSDTNGKPKATTPLCKKIMKITTLSK